MSIFNMKGCQTKQPKKQTSKQNQNNNNNKREAKHVVFSERNLG